MKMEKDKRYISPGGWFSLSYPAAWSEFEDGEDSFLFYNPDVWTGNFRISAYRGEGAYADECLFRELKENPQARKVQVGTLPCAYSTEDFEEEGEAYTTHFWVTGRKDVSFECSFTVKKGGAVDEAERIIRSLEVRDANVKYLPELIPVRLLEIYRINEAYEWLVECVENTDPEIVTDEIIDNMAQGRKALGLIYSGDASYVMAENPDMGYYMPESGTNLWSDAMVIPKNAQNADLAHEFINFVSAYEGAMDNSSYVGYTSPNEEVMNELKGPGGDYEGINAYVPRTDNENDEIFTYNEDTRVIISNLWSKVKLAAANAE